MTTIREQIILAIVARLQPLIKTKVLRAQPSTDIFPALSVWDIDESAQRAKFGVTDASIDLVIEYVDNTENANPSIMGNTIIGDVIKALIGTDPGLGGLATAMNYAGSVIDYPESADDLIAVRFAFSINYSFKTGDPYTAA